MAEMQDLLPWRRERISGPRGKEAVSEQGFIWGIGSGRSGVESPIGVPKLEMLAQHIVKHAHQLTSYAT
jgi:hypothetical protein